MECQKFLHCGVALGKRAIHCTGLKKPVGVLSIRGAGKIPTFNKDNVVVNHSYNFPLYSCNRPLYRGFVEFRTLQRQMPSGIPNSASVLVRQFSDFASVKKYGVKRKAPAVFLRKLRLNVHHRKTKAPKRWRTVIGTQRVRGAGNVRALKHGKVSTPKTLKAMKLRRTKIAANKSGRRRAQRSIAKTRLLSKHRVKKSAPITKRRFAKRVNLKTRQKPKLIAPRTLALRSIVKRSIRQGLLKEDFPTDALRRKWYRDFLLKKRQNRCSKRNQFELRRLKRIDARHSKMGLLAARRFLKRHRALVPSEALKLRGPAVLSVLKDLQSRLADQRDLRDARKLSKRLKNSSINPGASDTELLQWYRSYRLGLIRRQAEAAFKRQVINWSPKDASDQLILLWGKYRDRELPAPRKSVSKM